MTKITVEVPDDEYESFKQISEEILRSPENHVAFWIRSVVRERQAYDSYDDDSEGVVSERV